MNIGLREITIKNASEHNLKNISLKIPKNAFTVVTGVSGSGKSSLAFDTIYAEGQRRYLESLSSYARNYMGQLKRPKVDSIQGLSPALAIDQKSVGSSPRSTVGTMTEVYDYLRLLFARVGVPLCPEHGVPVVSRTPREMADEILSWPEGTKFYILAPVAQDKKGEFHREFEKWHRKGFLKARVNGEMMLLEDAPRLKKRQAHNIDLVVDQLVLKSDIRRRLLEGLQNALELAQGQVVIETTSGERHTYSIHSSCPECGLSFPNMEPRFFSFNHPRGACPDCKGLGTLDLVEEEIEEPEDFGGKRITVKYERRQPSGTQSSEDEDEDVDQDEGELTSCPTCQGTRLNEKVRSVKIHGKDISELSAMSVRSLLTWLDREKLEESDPVVAGKIVKELKDRLGFIERVGAGYLSLDRRSGTLSGGESQRLRLASQLGSKLVGVLYVMDEPSIGLHPRDHAKLLEIMRAITDRGNTLLVVEHDEDTMRAADHIVDMGPGAGKKGGQILAEGPLSAIMESPKSLTGQYMSGKKHIPVPQQRLKPERWITLKGARGHNLKNITVKIPLGGLVAVTGVSGSGKSSLFIDTLCAHLNQKFYGALKTPLPFDGLEGLEHLDKLIEIHQKPIGRTPRSTPATYVGVLPMVRHLFAQLSESKVRGYTPGRFSFNVKGGRCENCKGHGQVKVEMHFLADVYVPCDVCQGQRYNRETLQVKYKGLNISQVLELSVEEAAEFFKNHRSLHQKLETLRQVGLDYMTLGQSSTTLSGGESQRVKLARELSRRSTGKTLYILDEPTTGLHFEDIAKLVTLLRDLAAQGNTVVVIEHQLDVIKSADYVIDLGPEGGEAGGEIVAAGTPEQVATSPRSVTGKFLAPYLNPS
jgi:excinuclease ABC subunit A